MHIISSKKIWAGSFLVIVSIYLFFAYLIAHDQICIARTNDYDAGVYDVEPIAFKQLVSEMRGQATRSLINQFDQETGFFQYLIHPNGVVVDRDNDLRQLLTSRIFAIESHNSEVIRKYHKRNVDAIFENWYQKNGEEGYILAQEKSKLGSNALFLRVLIESPLYPAYKEEARAIAQGIMSLGNDDGSFDVWYVEPGYEYDADYLLTFYSGEALIALLEYYEVSKDQEILDFVLQTQDYYLKQYVEEIEKNYYPAYVPWHTLSLTKLYMITGEGRYADAVFIMNDKLLELLDTEQFIGRFYNPETPEYGTPHGSSDAVYTEGLASALAVAKHAGDLEREETYRNAIRLAVSNLKKLQHKHNLWNPFYNKAISKHLEGGIYTNICDKGMRIDSTAHAVDALSAIERSW